MKHPLETLLAGSYCWPALLSAVARASLGLTLSKAGRDIYMMDLNQLYTVRCLSVVLSAGAIEYLVLRWCGVAGFPSSVKPERQRFSGAHVWFSFAVGARRRLKVR